MVDALFIGGRIELATLGIGRAANASLRQLSVVDDAPLEAVTRRPQSVDVLPPAAAHSDVLGHEVWTWSTASMPPIFETSDSGLSYLVGKETGTDVADG